jgi:hypothetical protein
MRSDRSRTSKLDELDLAAIWPCYAPVAGLALPPIETVRTPRPERPDEVVSHGIW